MKLSEPAIGLNEWLAVSRVMWSKNLAQGLEVRKFEQEFSQSLVSGRNVVAVNSGTSGLHLALVALGIGRGDEVIVPSFSFAATANSVRLAGAEPVFCDIESVSFNIDPSQIRGLITSKTKAIMPVHLFGNPARMDLICQIAEENSLLVVEDAAQAHGAELHGSRVGTFGRAAVFSLYPTKNMTSGEGGMIVAPDEENDEKLRLLRNQGMKQRYRNEIVGYNLRMSDLHAAIGRVQLKRLDKLNGARRWNADYLTSQLADSLSPPSEAEGTIHVFHQYTIRVPDDRDNFAEALMKQFSVPSGVYYPVPCHRLPAYHSTLNQFTLPQTDKAASEVLSLPVHPGLTVRELDQIIGAVNSLARAGGD